MKSSLIIIGTALITVLLAWGLLTLVFTKPSAPIPGAPGTIAPGASTPALPPGQQVQVQPSAPVPKTSLPQDAKVIKAFVDQSKVSNPTVYQSVVVPPYATQVWVDTKSAGQALLKRDSSGGWTLVSLGNAASAGGSAAISGGAWTTAELVHAGVPQVVAQELVAGTQQDSQVIQAFLTGTQNPVPMSVDGTIVVPPYAAQMWTEEDSAGIALLKYASSTGWTLVAGGGGVPSVGDLVQTGVPQDIAQELMKRLGH